MNRHSLAHLYASIIMLSTVLCLLTVCASIVYAQGDIVLENVEFSSETALQYPQDVPAVAGDRIIIEYSDINVVVRTQAPAGPPSPPISRIIVEYADTAIQIDISTPQGKQSPDVSRIIIEYADYSRLIGTPTFIGPQPMGIDDTSPPQIGELIRIPAREVSDQEDVTVLVDISDIGGGVKNATLQYNLNNSTQWFNVLMTPNMTDFDNSLHVSFHAVIPNQPNGTWVSFRVVAYDYAWNTADRDGEVPYCPYQIIPEFPSTSVLLVLTFLSLGAIALARTKIKGRWVFRDRSILQLRQHQISLTSDLITLSRLAH